MTDLAANKPKKWILTCTGCMQDFIYIRDDHNSCPVCHAEENRMTAGKARKEKLQTIYDKIEDANEFINPFKRAEAFKAALVLALETMILTCQLEQNALNELDKLKQENKNG